MRLIFWLCFVVVLSVPSLAAQNESSTNSGPTVRELMERIQKLEARIDELEKKQSAAPGETPVAIQAKETAGAKTPPQTATAPIVRVTGAGAVAPKETPGTKTPLEAAQAPSAPAIPEHESAGTVSAENMPETQQQYPTVGFQGFADIDFSAQDKKGTTSGYSLGQFVAHFSGALSQRVSYFSELSLTATPTGYNAEVERSFIRFDYNDHLKVSFGRYHTPINYWNTAFHHGSWLQTTVARPEMIQFGGRLIPVHFVGALVEGTIPGSGSLNLNYNVGLGNGRGAVISRAGDAGDINNNRAWLVTVFARPDWASGWQVGGSVYRDKITLGRANNYREWIESAHVIYTKENPEFLAEFANIHHDRLETPGVFNSQAGYVQLGYRLPWFAKLWKPYYRFEYIHVPLSDPVFNPKGNPVPSLVSSVVGMRYDLTSFAAIKAEYRNSRRAPNEPRINGVFLQTSLIF